MNLMINKGISFTIEALNFKILHKVEYLDIFDLYIKLSKNNLIFYMGRLCLVDIFDNLRHALEEVLSHARNVEEDINSIGYFRLYNHFSVFNDIVFTGKDYDFCSLWGIKGYDSILYQQNGSIYIEIYNKYPYFYEDFENPLELFEKWMNSKFVFYKIQLSQKECEVLLEKARECIKEIQFISL